jgi:hypothetical protein
MVRSVIDPRNPTIRVADLPYHGRLGQKLGVPSGSAIKMRRKSYAGCIFEDKHMAD